MVRLKELRISKGLTQKQLANELNVAHNTISVWENNSSEPDLNMMNKLADFFDVSTDYLLGRTAIKKNLPIYRNPFHQELLTLFDNLPSEDKKKVIEMVRVLASMADSIDSKKDRA